MYLIVVRIPFLWMYTTGGFTVVFTYVYEKNIRFLPLSVNLNSDDFAATVSQELL